MGPRRQDLTRLFFRERVPAVFQAAASMRLKRIVFWLPAFYSPRLPVPFRHVNLRHSGLIQRVSSPYTAAGPCRNRTGFPLCSPRGPPDSLYLAIQWHGR
jgi:hypothetical protein